MRRGLYLLPVLLVLLAAEPALAASTPRPTDGGPYAYGIPEAPPLAGTQAVIHYVASGPDAPPLNDDDRDGLPDYVEQVSAAADKSLAVYAQQGFLAPRDYGWPTELPDIYIQQLDAGVFGLALPPAMSDSGSFVVLSNRLDPGLKAFGSLNGTVAHELFHLVQFAYVPNGELPRWVGEGQASAMEFIVYPEYEDLVSNQYLDGWLDEPWRPLYDERDSCSHCYGGSLWWYALHLADKGLIREYLGRLYGYQKSGQPILRGTQPLNEILERRGFGSLYKAYTSFSLAVYRAGLRPGIAYGLTATRKVKVTRVWQVAGLSTHYIPVKMAATSRGLGVAVINGAGPAPSVKLVLGGPKGRVVSPKLSNRGRRAFFEVRFRSAQERRNVMLVITSGRQSGVRYVAGYAGF